MQKIRFIHTADLHLDSPFKGMENLPTPLLQKIRESTFQSFERIVDVAINQEVDFVLIVGDIFDEENRSLRAQSRFRKEMERLKKNNIQVFISHGNHDHLGGNWIELSWPENVHIFENTTVESKSFVKDGEHLANIYGFSYAERAVNENKTPQYKKVENAPYHIGMLHGNLNGNNEHDPYAPFSIEELLDKDFSYWALGHIHKRQVLVEDPPIIYPGNIQGRHKKEIDEKGCYVVELDGAKKSPTFVPTSNINWGIVEIPINDITTFDELCIACETKTKKIRGQSGGKVIHLQITGVGDMHKSLQDSTVIAELVQFLNEGEERQESFVWINSIQVLTRDNWDREKLKAQQHFTGEVLHMIDSKSDLQEAISPLYAHRKAKQYLQEIDVEKENELYEKAETLLLMELLRK